MSVARRIDKLEAQERERMRLIETPIVQVIVMPGVLPVHGDAMNEAIAKARAENPGQTHYNFEARLNDAGELQVSLTSCRKPIEWV